MTNYLKTNNMKKGEIYWAPGTYKHPFVYLKEDPDNPDFFIGLMLTTKAHVGKEINVNLRSEHFKVLDSSFKQSGNYFVCDYLIKRTDVKVSKCLARLTEIGLQYVEDSIPEDSIPLYWDERPLPDFA